MNKFLFGIMMMGVLFGWGEPVPAGYIGRCWSPSGFSNEVVGAGRTWCGPRGQMYYMETTEQSFSVPVSILMKDQLEFNFNVELLVSVNQEGAGASGVIKTAFVSQRPDEKNTLSVKQLFNTYVKPPALEAARNAASKYETTEVVANQVELIERIRATVMEATTGSILRVRRVSVTNLKFPEVIERAQLAKAERNVQIETARAEGYRKAAEAEAKLKLARLEAQRELVEAQSVADANRIIASSISPQYLAYKQIEAQKLAADGENNMFFIPYRDAVNEPLDTRSWTNLTVDAAVSTRLREALRKSGEVVKDGHDVEPQAVKDK